MKNVDLGLSFDYYPLVHLLLFKGSWLMNALFIFVVRLILGLVFGILLTRLFRPDWTIYHGVITGLILVALAYGMAFFRTRKP